MTRDMWEEQKPISPEEFVRKSLDAVARNKGIIVVPAVWKLFWWLFRLSAGTLPEHCDQEIPGPWGSESSGS